MQGLAYYSYTLEITVRLGIAVPNLNEVSMLKKHPNNETVAIEILKLFFVPEKNIYKVKVRWWKIGTKNPPMCLNIIEKFEFTPEKLKEWKHYEW